MRTVVLAGVGAAGTTTVAAGVVHAAAGAGLKTLLITGADAELRELCPGGYRVGVGAEPVPSWLRAAVKSVGLSEVACEEIDLLPGARPMRRLFTWAGHARDDRWDLIVMDAGGGQDLLDVLTLDQLPAYLSLAWPTGARVAFAERARADEHGRHPLLDGVTRLGTELQAALTCVTGPMTSVRLVVGADDVRARQVSRLCAAIGLHGGHVDSIVVNRAGRGSPADQEDQRDQLCRLRASVPGIDLLPVPRCGGPRHPDLAAIGAHACPDPHALTLAPEGRAADPAVLPVGEGFEWRFAIAGLAQHDVRVQRRGDHVVLTVARHRRVVSLPPVLRRCRLNRARAEADLLALEFAPDPQQWPEGVRDRDE